MKSDSRIIPGAGTSETFALFIPRAALSETLSRNANGVRATNASPASAPTLLASELNVEMSPIGSREV